MTDLDFSVQIETPSSALLELEDLANGYEVHRDSLTSQAYTWRRQNVSSDWLEGEYTNRAVRGNVVEPLAVIVRGGTPFELAQRINDLKDAFGQTQYQVVLRFGDLQETWSCFPADYTIEAEQAMRFATLAVVRAQVPHLPSVVQIQVTP